MKFANKQTYSSTRASVDDYVSNKMSSTTLENQDYNSTLNHSCKSLNCERPKQRSHISRRWAYLSDQNTVNGDDESKGKDCDPNTYHRVILEAPFIRMKEVDIDINVLDKRQISRCNRSKSHVTVNPQADRYFLFFDYQYN